METVGREPGLRNRIHTILSHQFRHTQGRRKPITWTACSSPQVCVFVYIANMISMVRVE